MKGAIPRGVIYHRLRDDLASLWAALTRRLDDPADIRTFERGFAALHEKKHGISFPSARTAIWATLSAKGFPPGGEVLMPPITIKPILDVVLSLGLKPVYVDLDPETFCFDLDGLRRAITGCTCAAIITPLFGMVPDLAAMVDLCRAHGVFVIEDFSQCLFGTLRGKKVGTFGDVGIYSSSFIKTLDTYGGGQLVCDNDALAARLRHAQADMAAPNRWILARKIAFDLAMNLATTRRLFAWFVFPLLRLLARLEPGRVLQHLGRQPTALLPTLPRAWFHRYSSLQARLGLRLLPQVAAGDTARIHHVEALKQALADTPLRFPAGVPGGRNVYWQFVIPVNDAVRAQQRLHRHGVDTSTTSLTLIATLPGPHRATEVPVAEQIHEHGLFVPAYPALDDDDRARMVRALQSEIDALLPARGNAPRTASSEGA